MKHITRLPVDANGKPFSMPSFWIEPKEYGKIIREINQVYYAQYADKRKALHASFGLDGQPYIYWFENHGYNNYNIFFRVKNYY